MKEQSPQFINELKPVTVNGQERHQLNDGTSQFVSKEVANQALENSEQALRDTVKELESYGHEVSQFDHEVMSKQMGLESKPAKLWRKEVAEDRDPSAEEAEQQQHDERQAGYDELFAGKSDEDIDREVEAGGYRRRQKEAETKHKAEVEERAAKHEERRKFRELEDVQKMSVSELAGLLGEKPDFKVSKAEYVARVKAKQQEAIDYKAPTVDLLTPAQKEPSESTKATIEAIKKFHKEMGGVETDETKLLYKKFIKEDVDAFLSLSEKQKKEWLNPAEAIDLKLRAKLLQAAGVEGDESTIDDGYEKAMDTLMDDFLALTALRRIKGTLTDEEALTVERLKLLILDVNEKIDQLDGLTLEERDHSHNLMVGFFAEEDSQAKTPSSEEADEQPGAVAGAALVGGEAAEAQPEKKSRKKKLLAAAAGILALVGIGALASRLGDDETITKDVPAVETTVAGEDSPTGDQTTETTAGEDAEDDTGSDDEQTPVAGEDDDAEESSDDDQESSGSDEDSASEDEEDKADMEDKESKPDGSENDDADAEKPVVGAENFEVESGSGLIKEIKDFAQANGFAVDDDQAFALYQAGLEEFGKDGLITGSTYEISPGNIGIAEAGNTSWNPAFVQFMMDRMQPSADLADSDNLPETR